MPRKTKIIFIIIFILVGVIMLGWYFYSQKSKTSGKNGTDYNIFNSFGGGSTTDATDSDSGSVSTDTTSGINNDGETSVEKIVKLRQLTDFAVAGATFFEDTRPITETALSGGEATIPVETALPGGEKVIPVTDKNKKIVIKKEEPKFEIVPSLRYVERVTGHIYQMYLDTKTVGKISNSTIPSIYEAVFGGKAQSVIYRYLSDDNKTINSFMATLGASKGEFLPSNITDISLSPDKDKFFYITKTINGVVGTISSFNETRKDQVFSSPYSEWLSQWVKPQNIYLTTKASGLVEGNMFSLNTVNNTLNKVFGGILGLTTLANKDGSLVLYSTYNGSGPKLGVFRVANHTMVGLDNYGLPEKCVWSIDNKTAYCAIPETITGLQPDSWYKGLVSFDDRFIKIDAYSGEVSSILDNAEDIKLDATHLFLNNKESELYFINKKDSTLWVLDLN